MRLSSYDVMVDSIGWTVLWRHIRYTNINIKYINNDIFFFLFYENKLSLVINSFWISVAMHLGI